MQRHASWMPGAPPLHAMAQGVKPFGTPFGGEVVLGARAGGLAQGRAAQRGIGAKAHLKALNSSVSKPLTPNPK